MLINKKIFFKYTVKLNVDEKPNTYYVSAYTEQIARNALADMLEMPPEVLWLAKQLPWKVRKAIRNPNNSEHVLTLDIDECPDTIGSIGERMEKVFDLSASALNTIKHKVKMFIAQDRKILLNTDFLSNPTSPFKAVYERLRLEIIEDGYKDEVIENGIHLIDILDAAMHSIAYTQEGYQQMKTVAARNMKHETKIVTNGNNRRDE